MPTLGGYIRLRPLRIGFLVAPEDHASLRQIVRLNTCLWGGIYNPLIPFLEDSSMDRWKQPISKGWKDVALGYLRFFEPDVLVETRAGMAEKLGWKELNQGWRAARLATLEDFATEQKHGRGPVLAAGLNATAVYQTVYEEEYRFTRRHPAEVALVDPNKSGDGFLEVCFGSFPADGPLAYVRDFFTDAFSPRLLDNTAESYLAVSKMRMVTPLRLGAAKIVARRHGLRDQTVFVFDPNDGQDLIDYWNLRAFQGGVHPIHVGWLPALTEYVRELITSANRPIPGNPQGLKYTSTLEFGRSISLEKARELGQETLKGTSPEAAAIKTWYDPIWQERRRNNGPRCQRAQLDAGRQDAKSDYRGDGGLGVFVAPKLPFERDYATQLSHAQVVRFNQYETPPAFASVYPSNILDASYPEISRRHWVLTSREGWVFPSGISNDIHFTVRESEPAIVDWLKRQGFVAKATHVGRIARYIMEAVGGYTGLTLLADGETLKLLESMAATVTEHVSPDGLRHTERRFPDKARSTREWANLMKRRQKRLWQSWVNVDRFVEARILRLGLAVPCPECGTNNWHALDNLDYSLRCEHCLKDSPYPQDKPMWANQWQYKVSGPFASPGYAQGTYASLLTLRALHSIDGGDHVMSWASGIALDGIGELDLALWFKRASTFQEEEEPKFVVGEAKSFGEGDLIKDKDIATLKAAAEGIEGAYMLVAVLKTQLTGSEKARLVELANWGRTRRELYGEPSHPLIVLTGHELFAEHDVRTTWKDAGGRLAELTAHPATRVDDLTTLAEITQQVYLGLPDFYEDFHKQRAE